MDHNTTAPHSVQLRIRRAVARIVLGLLCICMLLVLIPIGARAFLNRWGAGLIARAEAIQSMGLEIDYIGYNEAVGSAVVNLSGGQRLTATRARLRYRLPDLLRGRANALALSGSLQLGDGAPMPLEATATDISWNEGVRADLLVNAQGHALKAHVAPSDGVMAIQAEALDLAAQLQQLGLKQIRLENGQLGGSVRFAEGGPSGAIAARAKRAAMGTAGGEQVSVDLDLAGLGADNTELPITLACSNTFFGKLKMGSVLATGQVSTTGMVVSSTLRVPGAGSSGQFQGRVDWEKETSWQTELAVTLAGTNGSILSLGELGPAGAGVFASGALQGRAWGGSEELGGVTATLLLKQLDLPARGFGLSDLTGMCALDPANPVRSLPGQLIRVRTLDVGALAFTDVRLRYQLEAGPVLLVEDLVANWCGGRVNASGVRVTPGTSDLDVRLLCDRLELEPLLRECGAPKVSGTGQFSGQLPVHWKNRRLTISHGFLYTTPGRGGSIAFPESANLVAFLPANPQIRQQADMLGEALVDFAYDWITLTLNTQDNYLHISTSIAGKPARMIPFTYDARTKSYVRLAKGKEGGMQRPMQLNLNFTVPLNQLLRYGVGTAAGIRKITGNKKSGEE